MTDIVSYYIYNGTGAITVSGKCYSDQVPVAPTGSTLVIGHPLTDLQPLPNVHKVDITTKAVVAQQAVVTTPVLDKSGKTNDLTTACANTITGGFRSNALGSMYFYPSQITDQLNLLHGGSLMCRDSKGTWAALVHTDAQASQVNTAFRTLRDGARTKLDLLLVRVASAATQADLDAIKWSENP